MIEEAERRQIFDLKAVERLLVRSHGRHGIKRKPSLARKQGRRRARHAEPR
jgi:hypothetical protein